MAAGEAAATRVVMVAGKAATVAGKAATVAEGTAVEVLTAGEEVAVRDAMAAEEGAAVAAVRAGVAPAAGPLEVQAEAVPVALNQVAGHPAAARGQAGREGDRRQDLPAAAPVPAQLEAVRSVRPEEG